MSTVCGGETPRDFFSHKHPKLLAKVVIYKPRYAIKTNWLDALEHHGFYAEEGLLWDVNGKSSNRKKAIKIMMHSFMVRRDFQRKEVMLVHIQWPWRLDPALATCSGWEKTLSNHQRFTKPGKMLGNRAGEPPQPHPRAVAFQQKKAK